MVLVCLGLQVQPPQVELPKGVLTALTVRIHTPPHPRGRSLFVVLDSLGSSDGAIGAAAQGWLVRALSLGDAARILEPVLLLLLQPKTQRTAIHCLKRENSAGEHTTRGPGWPCVPGTLGPGGGKGRPGPPCCPGAAVKAFRPTGWFPHIRKVGEVLCGAS